MATTAIHSNKLIKRLTSRKSHSWWWDSHISPKNSKWLAENLDEMDQSVKRMLRLIEEDGDTFAKKADMYYQKRPELITHVEDFYRMYRSLAERYDHLTGEIRKSMPSDLQSQVSGMSDIGSELPSTWPSPSPDIKISRRKSGPRALGFDVFLGPGTNDAYQKECDESSTLTDSDSESDDDSSVNNYSAVSANSGDYHGLNLKIIELEIDLREAREKLRLQQEENGEGPVKGSGFETPENILVKISRYEQELKHLNERIRLSDEVNKLKSELQRFRSLDLSNSQDELIFTGEDSKIAKAEDREIDNAPKALVGDSDLEQEDFHIHSKIGSLVDEQRITRERFEVSESKFARLKEENMACSERIVQLEGQLASAQKEIATWKTKYETEKKETTKLHERIARLKSSLSDREHEIRDLKIAVSDAEQKIFPEKSQMKAEMSKLSEERNHLHELVREWECRGRSFEEDIRNINAEKSTTEETLKGEIEKLHADITSRDDNMQNLEIALAALESEKEELHAKIALLKEDTDSRDSKILELEKHLKELRVEHAELISGMQAKAKELEEDIEKQRVVILEGDEAKREAIRQLCSAIEHYRNRYDRLRQALITAQKRGTASAS